MSHQALSGIRLYMVPAIMLILMRLSIALFFLSLAFFGGSALFAFQRKLEAEVQNAERWQRNVEEKCSPRYFRRP